MEEFDSHTEHAQDQAHEAAHESRERWITGVALTAAILAALAAITSMLSGHHEHEAMMEQVQAADQWNLYQAKGMKALIREERIENFQLAGEKVPATLKQKVADARRDQKEIFDETKKLEYSSHLHDELHVTFGRGVTLFQVAIAVAAISALTRRRVFWFFGIALGLVALSFLVDGVHKGRAADNSQPSESIPAATTSDVQSAHGAT